MKISVLTLFPDMFVGPFDTSIIKRAKEKGLVEIEYVNIRNFGIGKHKLVDDAPYGGGRGMVLRVDVIHAAIEYAKSRVANDTAQKIVLMSASGKQFKQTTAKEFAKLDHLIIICGHYEGVDERIKHFIHEEISIGDFIVTGGELPAMIVTDAVVRLIPGVLKEEVTNRESFSYRDSDKPLLEYPQYTRPPIFENHHVPDILLSGNHAEIEKWKHGQGLKKTRQIRPELLKDPTIDSTID